MSAVLEELASVAGRPSQATIGGFEDFVDRGSFRFAVPITGEVTLKVYDIAGSEIATLLEECLSAGWYNVTWDPAGEVSGDYWICLLGKNFVASKKFKLV